MLTRRAPRQTKETSHVLLCSNSLFIIWPAGAFQQHYGLTLMLSDFICLKCQLVSIAITLQSFTTKTQRVGTITPFTRYWYGLVSLYPLSPHVSKTSMCTTDTPLGHYSGTIFSMQSLMRVP